MKSVNTKWMEKTKTGIKRFLTESSDYEPLDKCHKVFYYSIMVFVFLFIALIISLFEHMQVNMIMTLMLICLLCTGFSLISGTRLIAALDEEKIRSLVITVIKGGKMNFTGRIVAVTDNEENVEFSNESGIALKKNRKYMVCFYERGNDLVITHAKQISANRDDSKDKD